MNIIETNLSFRAMELRKATNRIFLHHAEASSCTPEQIHQWHLNNGWSGAGYHFLVRKDGTIYRMRPEQYIGSHAYGSNSDSLGVCFEGKYNEETMPEAQINAGKELVAYLKNKYGINTVKKHSDVCKTSCPGSQFPFDEIANGNVIPTPIVEDNAYTKFVKAVQSCIGARVDGIAGAETLSKTITISAKINNRHAVVKAIQEYLYSINYCEIGVADGIAGTKFTVAVKNFQRDNGCIADGIITAKNLTWKKLLKIK